MAILSVQAVDLDGLTPVYTAADVAGDEFANDGSTYFYVKNGGGGPITVTIDSLRACDQGFDHNAGGAVAAGAEGLFGPFDKSRFNNSNGRVGVTYSGVTSVTVAAIKV